MGTEATFIAPKAGGYGNAPGIWSAEQIASWKKVTEAVHAKGSFIYLQLWALGRAADPTQLKKEFGPDAEVKSSGNVPFEGGATPTPLTEEEIKEYIELYAQAAKNSIEAGFDGVEIHGANGYLIDQFTQDNANNRTDAYGGSVEKRARFGIEVAKAVVEAVGADKTGIRLSPFSTFQGKKMKLAYIHVVESRISGNADVETTEKIDFLLDIWNNQSPVLVAGGFKPDSAKRAADEEYKDKDVLVVFG